MTAAAGEEVAAEPVAPRAAFAARNRRRWALFGGIAASVAVIDQLSKLWIDSNFQQLILGAAPGTPNAPSEVFGDWVRIAKSYNHGGIFGLLGDSAPILGLASLVVIAVIIYYQWRQGIQSPLLTLTLGLLLGGALGNLVDRLNHGYVIDFVDMGIGTTRWYTFNVADASISIAIVLLVVLSIFGDRIPGGIPAEPARTA